MQNMTPCLPAEPPSHSTASAHMFKAKIVQESFSKVRGHGVQAACASLHTPPAQLGTEPSCATAHQGRKTAAQPLASSWCCQTIPHCFQTALACCRHHVSRAHIPNPLCHCHFCPRENSIQPCTGRELAPSLQSVPSKICQAFFKSPLE